MVAFAALLQASKSRHTGDFIYRITGNLLIGAIYIIAFGVSLGLVDTFIKKRILNRTVDEQKKRHKFFILIIND